MDDVWEELGDGLRDEYMAKEQCAPTFTSGLWIFILIPYNYGDFLTKGKVPRNWIPEELDRPIGLMP